MKKLLLILLVPCTCLAAWTFNPALWWNSGTGKTFYGPYPVGVNTFTATPTNTATSTFTATATPTVTATPINTGWNVIGSSDTVFKNKTVDFISQGTAVGSGTAHFVYLGYVSQAITPKYVRFLVNATAGTESAAEVGYFSTTSAPTGSNMTLTKITSGVVATSFTSSAVAKNTSAFVTSIPAGTFLWAGILVTWSVAPVGSMAFDDVNTGCMLDTTSAATFATTSSYTGAVLTQNGGNVQGWILWGSLN